MEPRNGPSQYYTISLSGIVQHSTRSTYHPMLVIREPCNNLRAKGTRSVHTRPCVKHCEHVACEKREPDADRSERGCLMFLGGQHENSDD